MSTAKVFVRNPHLKLYDGQPLERGEVFQLRNQPNDFKLLRYDYVEEIDEDTEKNIARCLGCGREFADGSYQRAHNRAANHGVVDLDNGNVKAAPRPRQTPDPDGSGEWGLEPNGSPAPPPIEETGLGGRREHTAKGTKETVPFR